MPHIHEKIDFTTEVLIVHKDKVLLRVHDKYNKWLGVGGHIELDEDPTETAIREVKEEVGLDITLYSPAELAVDGEFRELVAPAFLNRHRINETHEHVSFIYFAYSETDVIDPTLLKEALPEIRWFKADELSDPKFDIAETMQKYAREALRCLSRSA